jgi:hypothetical protein
MRRFITCAAVVLSGLTAADAHAQIQLSMNEGRVTLRVKEATVRQVLTEWARIGQTRIVNAERVTGGPITIELVDVPEKQALDVLLRSVSGYLAAPRPAVARNLSNFDRILILPGTPQPRTTSVSAAPPPLPQPTRVQPFADPSSELPGLPAAQPTPFAVTPPPPAPPLSQGAPSPAFSSAVQSNSTSPAGTASPGMIVQPPAQPASPGLPVPPQNSTAPGVAPLRR